MSFRRFAAVSACLLVLPAAQAQTAAPDAEKGRTIAGQVCSACHGADGNSATPANPNLAAQHADYLAKQLANFKSQDGKSPERPSAIMAGMVANLSGDDMRNLGAFFEKQKPGPRAARDPQLVKQGQAIYRGGIGARGVAACTGCHGPSGAGVPAQFPRLAGQYPEYTSAQLKAFRNGERGNDTNRMMRSIAEKLSDREIAALADYLAGLH